jgi:glycerol-3-phosphate acyltransferase PlsX
MIMRKIILDCLGGDNGMDATIDGAIGMLRKDKDIILVMIGDRDVIKPRLRDANKSGNIMNRVEIVHTVDNIPLTEHPTEAIKNHPNSSICLGLELLRTEEECIAFVSAGSTGAVLSGGVLKIGRVEGLIRPALCPNLPTKTGVPAMLIDCGANADCKPETMAHFALMGKVYKEAEGMMLPKVGLLNIGAEEAKGNEFYQKTHQLLKKMGESGLMNFGGNVEARNALDGDFNIIVADGFTGNVLLKGIEGAVGFAFGQIKNVFSSGGIGGKIAGGLVGSRLLALKHKFSGDEGGSIFLGLKKPIIKCHGNADARTITSALQYALNAVNMNLGEKIKNAVSRAEPYLISALQNLPMPEPINEDEQAAEAQLNARPASAPQAAPQDSDPQATQSPAPTHPQQQPHAPQGPARPAQQQPRPANAPSQAPQPRPAGSPQSPQQKPQASTPQRPTQSPNQQHPQSANQPRPAGTPQSPQPHAPQQPTARPQTAPNPQSPATQPKPAGAPQPQQPRPVPPQPK